MRKLTGGECESGLGVCAAAALDALLHSTSIAVAATAGGTVLARAKALRFASTLAGAAGGLLVGHEVGKTGRHPYVVSGTALRLQKWYS